MGAPPKAASRHKEQMEFDWLIYNQMGAFDA